MFSVQKITQYDSVFNYSTHENHKAAELKAQSMAIDEKDERTVVVVLEVVRTNDNTVRIRPVSQYAAISGERRNVVTTKIPR
jgi:hypothetical protein